MTNIENLSLSARMGFGLATETPEGRDEYEHKIMDAQRQPHPDPLAGLPSEGKVMLEPIKLRTSEEE